MANSFITVFARNWTAAAVVWCACASATFIGLRYFESETRRTKRIQAKREQEIKRLTQRICSYAGSVRERFPRGEVVVGQADLAEELGRSTDLVVAALNVLLSEKKVQKAPLNGYWKLKTQ